MNYATRPAIMMSVFTNRPDDQQVGLFQPDLPHLHYNFMLNQTSHVYRRCGHQAYHHDLKVVTEDDAARGDMPDDRHFMLFSANMDPEENRYVYSVEGPMDMKERQRKSEEDWLSSLGDYDLPELPYIALNNYGRLNEIKETAISQGDILRLGQTFLRVTETHSSEVASLPLGSRVLDQSVVHSEGDEPKQCRICLQDDDPFDLISPCQCKGSCKYVHLACIKKWIEAKVVREQSDFVTSFDLEQFRCELCKKLIPSRVRIQDKMMSLVEWARPEGPYVVLESAGRMKKRVIYLVRLGNREVTLGRHASCDLNLGLLNDSSMSRQHCSLRFEKGQIVLKDCRSRYGTLILLQKRITFSGPMCIQADSLQYKLEPILPRKRLPSEPAYALPNPVYQPRWQVYV